MEQQREIKKILVIRFSSLGDVVLTTALFPSLRAKWPTAEIYALTRTEFAPVFDGNPNVDHVLVFDRKAQTYSDLGREVRELQFDIIIDLHANFRSWFIRLLASAPYTVVVDKATVARHMLVWLKRQSASLKLSVRERILASVKTIDVPIVDEATHLYPTRSAALLETFGIPANTRLIGIAPGARHNTKRWPASRYAEAANRLGAIPGTTIVVLGDKSDWPVCDAVTRLVAVPCKNLAGWTPLPDLITIVSRLSLLLTNDSGLMHIAEALNIPLVAIFGPTVRGFGFGPYRPSSRVVETINLPCRPCTLHGDDKCPLGHHNCMKDIDVNAVLFTASSLLEEPAPKA